MACVWQLPRGMTRIARVLLVFIFGAGCAAPRARSYAKETTAQKAAARTEMKEYREPPIAQPRLMVPIEPEPTPLRP